MPVTVVLDSNALWADPALRGAPVGRLMALCRRGLIKVAIPQVVLAELRRQRTERVEGKIKQLGDMPGKASQALRELGIDSTAIGFVEPVFQRVEVEALLEVYDREVRTKMRNNGMAVLPVPDIPATRILDRNLASRKPFDAQGRGLRDTLIWEATLALCNLLTGDDVVYLVTNDDDFGIGNEIAPELLDEIDSTGARLARATTIDALLAMAELSERQLAVQSYLEAYEDETAAAARYAVEAAMDEIVTDPPDTSMLDAIGVPAAIEDAWIHEVSELRDFNWSPYDEFDSVTLLGQATIVGDFYLQGTCLYSIAIGLEGQGVEIFDFEPDEDTWVRVGLTREAQASFDVRVELLDENASVINFDGLGPISRAGMQ